MVNRAERRLEEIVRAALEEDVGPGDVTTSWSVPAEMIGTARVIARAEGVVSGAEASRDVFHAVDRSLEVRVATPDGERVAAGQTMMEIAGGLQGILTAERTALNFLGRLSGIATLSRRYVAAVAGTGCTVVDTRKTTPGWRDLEKAATRAGGAENHRRGLHDMVLLKENHLRAAGGVGAALDRVMDRARDAGVPVEVEVDDLEQLAVALEKRPDRILLDNMSPDALRQAVERTRSLDPPVPLLEASGGVTLESVRSIAETGVDLVSVGALTHSAPALDVSLLVDRVEKP